jgi:inner membrane protein
MGTPILPASTLLRFMANLRPFIIGFLILIFLIPLNMVSGVIRDRIANHRVATESIASSWAGNQNVFGPVLMVPYTETISVDHFDPATQKTSVTRSKVDRLGFYIPDRMKIDVQWKVEERARGPHKAPVYTAILHLTGGFQNLDADLKQYRDPKYEIGAPYLSLTLTDIRGIGATPAVSLNGAPYDIQPGSRIASLPGGFHVPLTQESIAGNHLVFDINFDLKGIDSFDIVPAGGVVEMSGVSNWPHPSFKGQFLPNEKNINAEGFKAVWKTGLLATNILEQARPCILSADANRCSEMQQISFGVAFFQPVDIYTQSLRAAKYGILFVALTFAIFYVSEILQGTRVYTMQLLLIGFALAIFYLLLISLSEFLGFAASYLIAALAITGLLAFYSSFVLGNRRRGMMVGGIVAVLYAVLYFNISSEDYALLIGSVLLFVAIAAVMFTTRNVDWTALGKQQQDR